MSPEHNLPARVVSAADDVRVLGLQVRVASMHACMAPSFRPLGQLVLGEAVSWETLATLPTTRHVVRLPVRGVVRE